MVSKRRRTLEPLCNAFNSSIWNGQSVYLDCTGIWQGLANIRSSYISCIRNALDAHTHLIIPTYFPRSQVDLSAASKTPANMSTLFDEEKMVRILKTHCPKMKVVTQAEFKKLCEGENSNTTSKRCQEVKSEPRTGRGLTLDRWERGQPLERYKKIIEKANFPPGQIIKMAQDNPFFGYKFEDKGYPNGYWSTERLSEEREVLWDMVDFLPRMKMIGYKLRSRLKLNSTSTYWGYHARFESDWSPLMGEVDHSEIYRMLKPDNETCKYQLYVATGELASAKYLQFKGDVTLLGCKLVTKDDLLFSEEKKELERLEFDVKAQIDATVLMGAERFFPNGKSSFSFMVHHEADVIRWRLKAPSLRVKYGTYYHTPFICCF